MSIDQDITNLPTPPSRSDSPSDFSDKADAFLAALPQLQTELNTYADEANTTQTAINTSENNAATSEQNAEDWAVDLTGLVLSTDYSAKAYAVSENLVPEGAAKEWAIKTNGTVDGTEFSAKKYANDAEASASAAAATAGATAWSAGVTYNTNDAAIGSDGNTYRSLVDNNLNNDPVLGDGSNWLNLTGGADVTKATLTKTFAAGESASLTLSEPVETAPVVSVIKEVPQTGVTTNDWDVAADGANFTLHDTAYDTTLTPGEVGFQIELVEYDSVSFDISGQDTRPRSIAFNNDGTKMYILGANDDFVYQYSLNTAFDLSTASYDSVSFSILSENDFSTGITFNADGTKMYMTGNNMLFQYSLSTAFDLSTASYDAVSFDLSGENDFSRGIAFNNDGTKLFTVATANNSVFQYSLSTSFDISTASYDSVSFDTSGQESSPTSITFNNDGTKMYIVGDFNSTGTFYSYTLNTAFDLSTVSYDSFSFDMSSEDTEPTGIAFNADGTKLYMTGQVSNSVYQYSTSKEALVLGSGSFASTDVGKRVVGNGGEAILTAADGSYELQTAFNDDSTIAAGDWSMFALDVADNADLGLTLSGTTLIDSFDLEGSSYNNKSVNVGNLANTFSISHFFKPDGTRLFTTDESNIYELTLSTPWDIVTASYTNVNQSFTADGYSVKVKAFFFRDDGLKLYLLDTSIDEIYEYDLSSPWDITSSSYSGNLFSTASDINNLVPSIAFKPDGTKMYAANSNPNKYIIEYNLSIPWDISTASFNFQINVDDNLSDPSQFFFSSDGKYLFIFDNNPEEIFKYKLSVPWELPQAVFSGESTSIIEGLLSGTLLRVFSFGKNDTKLFVGQSDSILYEIDAGQISNFIPTDANHTAITSTSIDTELWTDINSMTADDASNEGAVYYAVSTDGRTTWKIIDDTEGERAIVRNNAGTWEVNDASDYGTETWVAASENDEFYALEEAVDVDTAQSTILVATIDTNAWSYNNVSFDTTDQIFNPIDGFFNNDGTKIQILFGGEVIHQYSLSTPFDLSTISYDNVSYDLTSELGNPEGFTFRNDGTKMYVVTQTDDSIYQYSLSTPFDLSTVSYDGVSYFTGIDVNKNGDIEFNSEGTKFYIVDIGSNSVYQYGLTTPFDISTASYDSVEFDFSNQTTNAEGFTFNSDGSYMYIIEQSGNVYQYSLSTSFNISTAAYTGVFSTSGQTSNAYGIVFGNNDAVMYVFDKGTNAVYQYSTGSSEFTSTNRMDAAQLNAVSDANHYTLGDDLDLAITFFMADGNTNSPTSDGVAVNYDANVLNQGAVLGTDYEFDKPTNDTVRITALSDENFKVRVV